MRDNVYQTWNRTHVKNDSVKFWWTCDDKWKVVEYLGGKKGSKAHILGILDCPHSTILTFTPSIYRWWL
jgi:hypothetical protein